MYVNDKTTCGNVFNKLTFEDGKLQQMYFSTLTFGLPDLMNIRQFAQIVSDKIDFVGDLDVSYDPNETYTYINTDDQIEVKVSGSEYMTYIVVYKYAQEETTEDMFN